jgi:aminoglycoside 6'-N-acetyltransferase I
MDERKVRPVAPGDAREWRRMRALLWPDADNDDDIARFFAGDTRVVGCGGPAAVLVAGREGGLGGFIEVGVRPFAAGCESRPVGYVEGWFVDEDLRRSGVGGALLRAAEAWARAQGASEMASDCYVDNGLSLRAHLALEFEEVERVILFRKRL